MPATAAVDAGSDTGSGAWPPSYRKSLSRGHGPPPARRGSPRRVAQQLVGEALEVRE
jgi:hypothetical protein